MTSRAKKDESSRRSASARRPERAPTAAEARAAFEAERAANKAAREAELRAAFPDGVPGRWIKVISWFATGVFALVTIFAIVDPDRFIAAYFAVAVGLFGVGCVGFVADLVLAAARSRDDLMGIGGIFLLLGSAPRDAQRNLLGAFVVQVGFAIGGAAAHPFTPLAVGTLVPTFGLAACGLWATLHGHFPAQTPTAGASR